MVASHRIISIHIPINIEGSVRHFKTVLSSQSPLLIILKSPVTGSGDVHVQLNHHIISVIICIQVPIQMEKAALCCKTQSFGIPGCSDCYIICAAAHTMISSVFVWLPAFVQLYVNGLCPCYTRSIAPLVPSQFDVVITAERLDATHSFLVIIFYCMCRSYVCECIWWKRPWDRLSIFTSTIS